MRLRKFLDRGYQRGYRDAGRLGRRPNPSEPEKWGRYWRWAYHAGWEDRKREMGEPPYPWLDRRSWLSRTFGRP